MDLGSNIFRCADGSPSDKQTEVWWRTFSYTQNSEFSLSGLLTSVSLPLRANFLRKKYLKFPDLQLDYIPKQQAYNNKKKKLQSVSSLYWAKLPRHYTQKFPLYSVGLQPRCTNFPADSFLSPECIFHVLPLSCSRSKLLPNSH